MDERQKSVMEKLGQLPQYSKEEKAMRANKRLQAACDKVGLLETLFRSLEALRDEDERKLERACHASFLGGLTHVTRSVSDDINSAEDAGTPAELWGYDLRDLEYAAIFKREQPNTRTQ